MQLTFKQIAERLKSIWHNVILSDDFSASLSAIPSNFSVPAVRIYKNEPFAVHLLTLEISRAMEHPDSLSAFLCSLDPIKQQLLSVACQFKALELRRSHESSASEMPASDSDFLVAVFLLDTADLSGRLQ